MLEQNNFHTKSVSLSSSLVSRWINILLLICLTFQHISVSCCYKPPLSRSERANLIYDQLKSNLQFNITEQSAGRFKGNGISIKNANGTEFNCAAVESSKKMTEYQETLQHFFSSMSNLCTMKNMGWWNYEWCYQENVKQFHIEEHHRSFELNMGKYKSTIVTLHSKEEIHAAPVSASDFKNIYLRDVQSIVDIYEDGNVCDETGKSRKTRVEFKCCDASELLNDLKNKNNQNLNSVIGKLKDIPKLSTILKDIPRITTVNEPNLCEYEMTICSSLMCQSESSGNKTILQLLSPISSNCFTKSDGWWFYDLCLNRYIRQYHFEQIQENGKIKYNLQGEFFLGYYNKEEDTELVPEDEKIVSRPSGEKAFTQEFVNGTKCDLSGENRSTTVEFVCGETESLISIIEDKTCHYKVLFSTRLLCEHPKFKVDKPSFVNVQCLSNSN